MNDQHIEAAKHVGDAVSALVVVGALASFLPPIASLFTIIWMAIRIYESKTVQDIINRKPD